MRQHSKTFQRLLYFASPRNTWNYLKFRFSKTQTSPHFVTITPSIIDKVGIEIGGPSTIFSNDGAIPIYPILKRIDGCNYSNMTIWESDISKDNTYRYKSKYLGSQFILEATNLTTIYDGVYDFLVSSHCLEHVANPLKAMEEWIRVIKPSGLILIIVPMKEACFDHRRPETTFEHIHQDYSNNTGEGDLTHLTEILSLHDLSMDLPAGSYEEFKIRSENNIQNRCLHHHVFSKSLLVKCFSHFEIEATAFEDENNIYAFGYKPKAPLP